MGWWSRSTRMRHRTAAAAGPESSGGGTGIEDRNRASRAPSLPAASAKDGDGDDTDVTSSLFWMCSASAMHMLGYEWSRSAVLSLMTSDALGFERASAVSYGMGCVSPTSVALLWLYKKSLDTRGPEITLRRTSQAFAALLAFGGVAIGVMEEQAAKASSQGDPAGEAPPSLLVSRLFGGYGAPRLRTFSRILLFFVFVVQNGLVQLLFSQHWSFLGSVMGYSNSKASAASAAARSSGRAKGVTNTPRATDDDASSTRQSAGALEYEDDCGDQSEEDGERAKLVKPAGTNGSPVSSSDGVGAGGSSGSHSSTNTSKTWALAPMAGIGSLASTLAGVTVSPLLQLSGNRLGFLVVLGSLGLFASTLAGNEAYRVAHAGGFAPPGSSPSSSKSSGGSDGDSADGKEKASAPSTEKESAEGGGGAGNDDGSEASSTETPLADADNEDVDINGSGGDSSKLVGCGVDDRKGFGENALQGPCSKMAGANAEKNETAMDQEESSSIAPTSLWGQSCRLFRRRPVLAWLCCEVLAYQGQSSLLNFLWVHKVRKSLALDHVRAEYTAQTFAWINFLSGVMQFLVLPIWTLRFTWKTSRGGWVVLPLTMLSFVSFQLLADRWTLDLITLSFLIMKTLEYSLRGVLMEMVYVSLDHESRFVGKQIITLFANRLGKSAMALALSVTFSYLPETSSLFYTRRTWLMICLVWVAISTRLSRCIFSFIVAPTLSSKQSTLSSTLIPTARTNAESTVSSNRKVK